MSNINDDINKDFETIKNIVLTITLLFADIKYFKTGIDKERKIISEYKFLWRIYNSLYINMILDFHKLFNDDESYSFNRLFNKLENNFKRIKWADKPSKSLITSMKTELVKIKSSEVTDKIKTARDQFYAHLDNKRPPNISILLDDLERLLTISQRFINNIRGALDNTHQSFDFGETDIGHYMISDLYKYNLIRHTIYRDIEDDFETSTKKIIDILRDN